MREHLTYLPSALPILSRPRLERDARGFTEEVEILPVIHSTV